MFLIESFFSQMLVISQRGQQGVKPKVLYTVYCACTCVSLYTGILSVVICFFLHFTIRGPLSEHVSWGSVSETSDSSGVSRNHLGS